MLMPSSVQAGILSLVSDMISPSPVPPAGEVFHNTQTMPILESNVNLNTGSKGGGDIMIVEDSALEAPSGPLGTLSQIEEIGASHEISSYVVREGDTLSGIAEMFDVSANTIIWANDIKNGVIKPGDTLIILPVSGILHTVKSGETLKGIVGKYKADLNEVLAYNDLGENAALEAGDTLTIPDGEIAVSQASKSAAKSTAGYYIRPTKGVKTQGIHGYNGIDIGASVGTPVVASAGGTVIVSRSGGWNGGYGSYVVVKHGNGTQTLYAHLSRVDVVVGESVSQGQSLGAVGNTGKSTGPHLHFEVRGAKNPF